MEKIKKFNLGLILFLKEIHSHIEKGNEIDGETVNLMTEIILAVDKLQIRSTFRETSSPNDNQFAYNLNDEIFEFRQCIACRLCHEPFQLNSEDDFKVHIQKRDHKEKETKWQLTRTNESKIDRTNTNANVDNSKPSNWIQTNGRILSGTSATPNSLNSKLSSSTNSLNSNNDRLSRASSFASNIENFAVKLNSKMSGSTQNLNSSVSSSAKRNDSFSTQSLKTAIGSVESMNIQKQTPPAKLENIIKVPNASDSIRAKMNNLLSRTNDRIRDEANIIQMFTFYFSTIDDAIKVIPFGSATYGYGSATTNLNMLIKTDPSKQSPDALLCSLEHSLKTSGFQQDFELLGTVTANRAQKQQLKVMHKKSRIQCLLWFDLISSTIDKSSEIIRGYMNLFPLCKKLIACIKSWHDFVNEFATSNGLAAFRFNSYIISILVIFYLQANHKLPTSDKLSSALSDGVRFSSGENLDQFVVEFFRFFRKLEVSRHLISLNMGKWQERELQPQQRLSPEQQSMRNAMDSNPRNWINCAMYVQDIASPDVNIAAEISKHEANNFKLMCTLFSSHLLTLDDPVSSLMTGEEKVLSQIDNELLNMRNQLTLGMSCESEITSILSNYIHQHRKSLKVIPFGSSQYGFQRPKTNFHLLINTNGEKPKDIGQLFFRKLERTDIQLHFENIHKIGADRVLRRQYIMTHRKSRVQCFLVFDSDSSIADSSEIISQFVLKEPMCRFLISYISAWQTVLNRQGSPEFEFNTYIISVLVIFFLQVNYKIPTLDNIANFVSNANTNVPNFKTCPRQFFDFYGNRYQMHNHVISAHIGQWQEMRCHPEQTRFSEAKQRLRNGIETSPENWTNCTMYVQDLVRPNINITAEIPQQSAKNFQKMCQIFAKIE